MIIRVVSILLRGGTLAAKFLLIVGLARLLPPAEFAAYGIFSATIAYLLMVLGFDFYTYGTRELIGAVNSRRGAIVKSQAGFFGLIYVIALPMCLLLFSYQLLPAHLMAWFFILLVLEHFVQEAYRLLVALRKPLWAGGVLFIRSGAWAIPAAISMWYVPQFRLLDFVFLSWTLGGALAALLAWYCIRAQRLDGFDQPVDWGWIRRGLKSALPFALATLSLKALSTLDRYWIEAVSSVEVLAAYIFFAGIANALINFLDAAVFSFSYPALIDARARGDAAAFARQMRQLSRHTLAWTVALSGIVLAAIPMLASWLHHPGYSEHLALAYWTILATVLMALGMVPHYGLYAIKADKPIIRSHIAALAVFVASAVFLTRVFSDTGVPIALAIAFLFLFAVKTIAFRGLARRCGLLSGTGSFRS